MNHYCAALLAVSLGCGGAATSIDGSLESDAAVGDDSGSTKPEVFGLYSTIETVAGTGNIEDKGVNGWQPQYEGAPATDAELSRPHIAIADANGVIYIADKDAHAIRAVAIDGTIHTVAGTGEPGDDGEGPLAATTARLSSPNGLWVRSDGTLYILDLGNDKVRRVDTNGVMTTLFDIGGAGTGRGLWVKDDESVVYVAAGKSLKKWTPTQGVTVLASGFTSLGNIAVGPFGQLVVTDRLAHRVYEIDSAGTKSVLAGNGATTGGGDGSPALETGLNEVRGVWFHPNGGYLLATHKGGQIWYVDTLGTCHLFVDGDRDDSHTGDGGRFDSPGAKISEPRSVTVAPNGDIIITEHDAGYIRRLRQAQ